MFNFTFDFHIAIPPMRRRPARDPRQASPRARVNCTSRRPPGLFDRCFKTRRGEGSFRKQPVSQTYAIFSAFSRIFTISLEFWNCKKKIIKNCLYSLKFQQIFVKIQTRTKKVNFAKIAKTLQNKKESKFCKILRFLLVWSGAKVCVSYIS